MFTSVASVRSLINGDPYDDINLNNIDDLYISAFNTSIDVGSEVSDYT